MTRPTPRAAPPWWLPTHDGYAIAGRGMDDVDHVPAVNRPPALNPDCRDGKHQACAGDAWDTYLDEPTRCACPCHE